MSTVNDNVVTNRAGLGISSLVPCSVEGADESIFVHVKRASRKHARIMIKTVDSHVVVIAIADFHQLAPLNELWIEFGEGKSLRFISINNQSFLLTTYNHSQNI